jgi:phenylacetate-CoA ligase
MMSFACPVPQLAYGGLAFAPDVPGGHSQRYFDARETRPSEDREQELMARLPNLVRSAKVAKGWAWMLSAFESRAVFSREALAKLPVLRRRDLALMQSGNRRRFTCLFKASATRGCAMPRSISSSARR